MKTMTIYNLMDKFIEGHKIYRGEHYALIGKTKNAKWWHIAEWSLVKVADER